jgi:ATP-dependent RNA helicase DDX21
MQQKIFGKTIVFTETKAECDELVSGGVFKTLTAQAIHGDVAQKQRDSTLAAFRAGAFNVLVATDVAARGIDIKDVDLVIQLNPPRDTDTYVHRSGRTGRAGAKGISVVLFQQNQARDIVRMEKSLGHGFKFELIGPPSMEAALSAAAKTSAVACRSVADETVGYFKDAANSLLASTDDPADIVARCLAAIARRTVSVESRSLLTVSGTISFGSYFFFSLSRECAPDMDCLSFFLIPPPSTGRGWIFHDGNEQFSGTAHFSRGCHVYGVQASEDESKRWRRRSIRW